MARETMTLKGPNGPTVATDTDFVGQSEPWSEYLVERPGKKTIRVRVKVNVTHIFVSDELTPTGAPILNVSHVTVVKAEELEGNGFPVLQR